jgi:hypothetical protein
MFFDVIFVTFYVFDVIFVTMLIFVWFDVNFIRLSCYIQSNNIRIQILTDVTDVNDVIFVTNLYIYM